MPSETIKAKLFVVSFIIGTIGVAAVMLSALAASWFHYSEANVMWYYTAGMFISWTRQG